MKQRILVILTLLLFSMGTFSQHTRNTYESNWQKVDQFANESLPKSAIEEINIILTKALDEGNAPQIMKAYMELANFNYLIDNQTVTAKPQKLEKLLLTTQSETDKALIHIVLAELYINTYNEDKWAISRRTNLADEVPEDMAEWTSNIFRDKVYEHLEAAVTYKDALLKDISASYDDIIKLGKDSRIYQPTLYDFVMNRVLETAQQLPNMNWGTFDLAPTNNSVDQLMKPAKEYIKLDINKTKEYVLFNYYQQYLANLNERGLTSATILIELNKYDYLSNNSNKFYPENRLDALYNLEKIYAVDETTVEIIIKIVSELETNDREYYYSSYSNPSNTQDLKSTYEWLKKGIAKYPLYHRTSNLEYMLYELEAPLMSIEDRSIFYSHENIVLKLKHKNNQIIDRDKILVIYKTENGVNTPVKEISTNYSSQTSYSTDTVSLELGKLPYGSYYLSSKDEDHEMFFLNNIYKFTVTDIYTYTNSKGNNKFDSYVVDRKNGKPIKGAKITITNTKDTTNVMHLVSNQLGMVSYEIKNEKNDYHYNGLASYTISVGEDAFFPTQTLYNNNYSRDDNFLPEPHTISIFADRSIYRPGQTIYFKALVLDQDSKTKNKSSHKLEIRNANWDIIFEKTYITNEFGSFAGEFVLPQTGLTGRYSIMADRNESISVSVEEYKRPTFEITFDKIEKTYSFGEKIILKGKAKTFSGISLQDATVDFNVQRSPFSFWFWQRHNSHFGDGKVKTKDDGSFEIEFTPEAGDAQNFFRGTAYTFTVNASITDLNGETQTADYTISVGDISMFIQAGIPGQIEKSQEIEINIEAKNLDGADIEAAGTYTIYALKEGNTAQNKVAEGVFKTGKQDKLLPAIKKLTSGRYKIEFEAKDNNNKIVKAENQFILFSYLDKKPPFQTDRWIVEKTTTFDEKNPVEIIYGTSRKNAYILYQIYDNKTIFEQKFIKLNDSNHTFKIPYKKEYGESVNISYTDVWEGDKQTITTLLNKKEEEKDQTLDLKLTVFRDKLRPGQEETWTLSIKDKKGASAMAEILASMYDSSLDKLTSPQAWLFNRPYVHKEYLSSIYFGNKMETETSFSLYFNRNIEIPEGNEFDFDQFKFSSIFYKYGKWAPDTRSGGGVLQESVVMARPALKSTVQFVPPVIAEDAAWESEADLGVIRQESGELASQSQQGASEPQIRRNFNETAFFYPQLRTNEKGETLISFTVPESNTTWKFRTLAHDKEGRMGKIEKMVVTRKELMVTPNMPRFVRHGDKTSISAKISNLSENAISGKVRIEFFDPIDEKITVLKVSDATQSFNLEKEASSSATWTFDVPADIDMMGVRIVAESESFSDGEQHVLAVLPNRMLVTETMPVDVTQKGEQSYTMEKLANNKSTTLDHYKLSFEFASDPAWYAIQALPTMSNPSNENTINWFASYYVNTMGASLMKRYPKVANVIQAWTKQGGDKQTLVSKLYENEELKTILLEETPWVLDSKSETEQMKRLSLLFDLNNTNNQTNRALEKLMELQTSSGAWSWYKGMYPHRSITQYLLFGFANLQLAGMVEYPEHVKTMQMNALKFVDEKIVEDFNNLKKENKDWKKIKSINSQQLEYLYIRTMYRDIPISHEAREAERFYTEVVSNNWTTLNLYQKSLLAIVAKELANKDLASKITRSIKEHAVNSKELGMYWPNNKNNVFISMSAVSSHLFLMEALKANVATAKELDNMKRWLVKQKQTLVWENTNATIHAISTLLQDGTNWIDNDTSPSIKVGGKAANAENKELGTNYFKTSWSKNEITNNMATVSIHSEDDKPAYGALYWQYYEDMDKVSKQDGSLNINKELYKEVVDASGKNLVKITESNPLKVGDKVIVRLVIRTDRDMEFVQIKDMRASCFEPLATISGMAWQNKIPYYQATKDASTNFFIDVLPKGTYVFEYAVHANRTGEYSNGITSIQSAYAPEFTAHTAGIRVVVK